MKGPSIESRLCIPIEAKVLHKMEMRYRIFRIEGVLTRIFVIIQKLR